MNEGSGWKWFGGLLNARAGTEELPKPVAPETVEAPDAECECTLYVTYHKHLSLS